MSELTIEPEMGEGGIRLRLGGVLDGSGAYLLRDQINQAGQPVVVDFSRLQRLSDFGLGILAMGLSEMPNEVQFLGLGHHAQRILRAFGVANAA
ncbi:STAS domain-containing protein [Vulgatibacter sp.]|uniref:STAS domain-containing protein n=1 Tax=Vulgatibacter sp. TaxID=1971226 RepID=UPI003565B044